LFIVGLAQLHSTLSKLKAAGFEVRGYSWMSEESMRRAAAKKRRWTVRRSKDWQARVGCNAFKTLCFYTSIVVSTSTRLHQIRAEEKAKWQSGPTLGKRRALQKTADAKGADAPPTHSSSLRGRTLPRSLHSATAEGAVAPVGMTEEEKSGPTLCKRRKG